MKKSTKLSNVVSFYFCILFLCGCSMALEPMPTNLNAYKAMPLKKLVNQVYAKDLEGKYIKVDVYFGQLFDDVGGAPSRYRNGEWVRISIRKENADTIDVMVPKSEADICFELKMGGQFS